MLLGFFRILVEIYFVSHLPSSTPSQITIGATLLRSAQAQHLTEALRIRKQRNQERRMGSGGDEDDVVQQWLDRTAIPPALSANDCEVQDTGSAMVRFSSAHAICARIPEMRATTLAYVGLAALQAAYENNQCIGVWPDATAIDRAEEAAFALEQRRMHGTGQLEQSRLYLKDSLAMAINRRQWETAGLAAKGLADSTGAYDAVESAKMICLWQSCVARREMHRVYRTASRSMAPEVSFVRRVSDTSSAGASAAAMEDQQHYLRESSMAWRRLDCSADMDDIMSMMPRAVPVLVVQATPDFSSVYVAALRNTGETTASTAADGVTEVMRPIIDAAVYRHHMDVVAVAELKAVLAKMSAWRKRLAQSLAQGPVVASFDRETMAEADPANHELDAEIVAAMKSVLDPMFASPEIMGVLNNPEVYPAGETTHAVFCLDFRLQTLPVELCPTLQRWRLSSKQRKRLRKPLDDPEAEAAAQQAEADFQALCKTVTRPALSRDFSMHVLGDRLRCAGGETGVPLASPFVNMGKLRYIVDPRNEDRPDESVDRTSIDANDPESEALVTTSETLEAMRVAAGGDGSGWDGIRGKDVIPSWGEWQRMISSAAGDAQGCFLSYGLGPCLAHFPAQRAAGLSVKGLRLALLLGRSATESSLRRLAKLANKKTNTELQLEQQVETAVLMTLAGVDAVVVNAWAASLTANRRLALGVVTHLAAGKTVAEAIDLAAERVAEKADPSLATPANSRPGTGAGKKGKKGKKGQPPAKAKGKAAETTEKKAALKMRVKMNPTVFGLPHILKQ